jgi:Fe2+ transport system protein FeoA
MSLNSEIYSNANSSFLSTRTLKDVPVNSVCTIKAINNPNAVIRNRLLSFGLVEGRQVKVTRTSPFGGTICVELIGYSLALRLSEADCLSVLV